MFALDMPGDLGFVENKLWARINFDSICIEISQPSILLSFGAERKEQCFQKSSQKYWSELMFPEWENGKCLAYTWEDIQEKKAAKPICS